MPQRYSSVCLVAFTLHHDTPDPATTPASQIRAALMRRIADLDEAQEWDQAVAFNDTVQGD